MRNNNRFHTPSQATCVTSVHKTSSSAQPMFQYLNITIMCSICMWCLNWAPVTLVLCWRAKIDVLKDQNLKMKTSIRNIILTTVDGWDRPDTFFCDSRTTIWLLTKRQVTQTETRLTRRITIVTERQVWHCRQYKIQSIWKQNPENINLKQLIFDRVF